MFSGSVEGSSERRCIVCIYLGNSGILDRGNNRMIDYRLIANVTSFNGDRVDASGFDVA